MKGSRELQIIAARIPTKKVFVNRQEVSIQKSQEPSLHLGLKKSTEQETYLAFLFSGIYYFI